MMIQPVNRNDYKQNFGALTPEVGELLVKALKRADHRVLRRAHELAEVAARNSKYDVCYSSSKDCFMMLTKAGQYLISGSEVFLGGKLTPARLLDKLEKAVSLAGIIDLSKYPISFHTK